MELVRGAELIHDEYERDGNRGITGTRTKNEVPCRSSRGRRWPRSWSRGAAEWRRSWSWPIGSYLTTARERPRKIFCNNPSRGTLAQGPLLPRPAELAPAVCVWRRELEPAARAGRRRSCRSPIGTCCSRTMGSPSRVTRSRTRCSSTPVQTTRRSRSSSRPRCPSCCRRSSRTRSRATRRGPQRATSTWRSRSRSTAAPATSRFAARRTPPTTRSDDLVSLLKSSRFRPRLTDGEFADASPVVVRYYLYD